MVVRNYCVAPHRVEASPAGVAWRPREARIKSRIVESPTYDQSPPRQEGEGVARPWLRKIRDGAGGGGWEQFDTGEVVVIRAADHGLP